MAHNHTIKSESYSVGMLAKKIYRMDATSTLFQRNKDANAIKVRFEQSPSRADACRSYRTAYSYTRCPHVEG